MEILSRKVNQTDALHVSCDWLLAVEVTLSDARALELIVTSGSNPDLMENEHSEPTELDLNWAGII